MKRLSYNIAILKVLHKLVEKNPDLRFHQILIMSGITRFGRDDFFRESSTLLEELEGGINGTRY